jgi:hypothetical protein
MSKLLGLFYTFFSLAAAAPQDICEKANCPEGHQDMGVCFVDAAVRESTLRQWNIVAECDGAEIYYVESVSEITVILGELARQCKQISTLSFAGHGRPGEHGTGLELANASALKAYTCLMTPNINVRLSGCNVGEGCAGDLFLMKVGQNLLHKWGGTVEAPTAMAITYPFFVPFTSVNGRNRVFKYQPSSKTPSSWGLSGLAIGNGGTWRETCSKEINGLYEAHKSAYKEATRRGCRVPSSHRKYAGAPGTDRKIDNLLKAADSDVDFQGIHEFLTDIKWDIETLVTCSPTDNPRIPKPTLRGRGRTY